MDIIILWRHGVAKGCARGSHCIAEQEIQYWRLAFSTYPAFLALGRRVELVGWGNILVLMAALWRVGALSSLRL